MADSKSQRPPARGGELPTGRADERLSELLAASPMVIYACRPEGDYGATYVSPNIEGLFGYRAAEWLEDSSFWADRIHEEDREGVFERLSALEEKEALATEYRFLRADGSYASIRDSVRLRRDASGAPLEIVGAMEDVSELRAATRALKQSEEKYQALLATTDTGFGIFDVEGHLLDANQEYARLAGRRSAQDLLGRSVAEWTAGHDRARNVREVEECRRRGFVRNLEVDYVAEDGRITPVEINAMILGSGPDSRILALCRDVGERKSTQAALLQREALLRATIESLPFEFFAIDTTGRYFMENVVTRRHWGSVVGKTVEAVAASFPQGHTWFENNRRAFAGELVEGVAEYVVEGRVRTVQQIVAPILDEEARVVGILGMNVDQTERREAELSLRESERNYREIFDATSDAIVVYDAETGATVDVNRSMLEMFGYSREEALGLTPPRGPWARLPTARRTRDAS